MAYRYSKPALKANSCADPMKLDRWHLVLRSQGRWMRAKLIYDNNGPCQSQWNMVYRMHCSWLHGKVPGSYDESAPGLSRQKPLVQHLISFIIC